MCVRKNNRWNRFACLHKLPQEICEYYSHKLEMCLRDPTKYNRIDYATLVYDGHKTDEVCWYCRNGKDIDSGGAYEHGKKWELAYQFRKNKKPKPAWLSNPAMIFPGDYKL
ncbi:hypothetical protein G6514_004934 [Epicoccum nigrum]|nr:hypothetical protein G6514_004934 [Epicoccum nigrum]